MIMNILEKGVGKVMTKYFCDRCNKEIEDIDDGYNLEIVCYQRCRKPEFRYIDECIFICKECADDILHQSVKEKRR